MSIEFRCDQCQHLLRTGDDTVGRKARCPQCGNIQTVPAAAGGPAPATPLSGFDPHSSNAAATPSPQQNPFALDPSPNPYQASAAAGMYLPSPESIRSKLLGPAIALLIVNGLSCALTAFVLFAGIVSVATEGMADDDAVMLVLFSVSFIISLVAVGGSIQMLRQRSYAFAVTAAVLTLLPTGCVWCVSLPFGIWALVVLLDQSVRGSFH